MPSQIRRRNFYWVLSPTFVLSVVPSRAPEEFLPAPALRETRTSDRRFSCILRISDDIKRKMTTELGREPLDLIDGLSSQQARDRLVRFGANVLTPSPRRSAVVEILLLFANLLALILLLAATVPAVSGRLVGSSIIFTVVLLGAAINHVQTNRSQRAAERLRAQIAPSATILRDGTWREIHRRDVVPDHVIHLTAGDLVPADVRLLESRDLLVLPS